MKSYKINCIILKRKNFMEADRLVTVFTRDLGKLKLLAKGSRKPLSKMGGILQTFNLVHLLVHRGRTFDIITGGNLIEAFKPKNLEDVSEIFTIAELIDKFIAEEDPHPEVYDLVKELYDFEPNEVLLNYFKFKLLDLVGLGPELGNCVNCSNKLEQDGNGFSPMQGVLCPKCLHLGFPVKNETIKFLRLTLNKDADFIFRLKMDDEAIEEIGKIINIILAEKTHVKLNSNKFVQEVKSLHS
ncbi:MAG: DNA repair protein RecO [Patescibacteria group bacterium]